MKKFSDLNKKEQTFVKNFVLDMNTTIASRGLLGFKVKKLAPSKENKQRFDQQFTGHPLCGCVGCMELAKIFIDKAPDMKEAIVTESMNDLNDFRIK